MDVVTAAIPNYYYFFLLGNIGVDVVMAAIPNYY